MKRREIEPKNTKNRYSENQNYEKINIACDVYTTSLHPCIQTYCVSDKAVYGLTLCSEWRSSKCRFQRIWFNQVRDPNNVLHSMQSPYSDIAANPLLMYDLFSRYKISLFLFEAQHSLRTQLHCSLTSVEIKRRKFKFGYQVRLEIFAVQQVKN